ncbi:hypothetical protein FAZ69_32115 [Trinickia terrae]|uniref:DUF2844 domain-containing protein n=1 Tax=Trinickia terrae TaxID=2571161 RepID=A0A4U1HBA9_9BURK|nr:hypothetical protein [Trinickia terrae]TKC78071.1 hypothetical protein FAZ69_32115 [Trinickia terrae]
MKLNLFRKSILLICSLTLVFTCEVCWAATKSVTISFLGEQVSVNLEPRQSQDGEGVELYLTNTPENQKIYVDFYEPEGGATPEIKSIFVSGKNPKKLFVIVAWNGDDSAIGTGGSIYEVSAYDELIERSETQIRLHQDTTLTKRFGVGFDGVREGKRLRYKYKTASSVRHQLIEWGYR